MKKTIFGFVIADLIESEELAEKLMVQIKSIEQEGRNLFMCINGGQRLRLELQKMNCEFHVGPSGPYLNTSKDRQVAWKVLEKNQVALIELLEKWNVNARVVIPVILFCDLASFQHIDNIVEIVYATPCEKIFLFCGKRDYFELINKYSEYSKVKVIEID